MRQPEPGDCPWRRRSEAETQQPDMPPGRRRRHLARRTAPTTYARSGGRLQDVEKKRFGDGGYLYFTLNSVFLRRACEGEQSAVRPPTDGYEYKRTQPPRWEALIGREKAPRNHIPGSQNISGAPLRVVNIQGGGTRGGAIKETKTVHSTSQDRGPIAWKKKTRGTFDDL